jgi:arylsulfatase B
MRVLLSLLLLCQLPQVTAQYRAELPRKNLAVIVLDDIGKYDVKNVDTPTLDSFAAGAVSFFRANTTSSMCSPSRTALTGSFGQRIGIGRIILKTDPKDMPLGTPTIASHLQAAGYATCMVGKWHLSSGLNYTLEDAPGLFGFDTWRAVASHNPAATLETEDGTYFNWGRIDDGVLTPTTQYMTEAQSEAAIDWWQQTSGPKFLWLAYNAAHAPFHMPPSNLLPRGYTLQGLTNRDLFEPMIMAVDHSLQSVLDVLDDGNTVVMMFSDNGTPQDATAPAQDPTKVKMSMFEGGVGTIFLASAPGVAPTLHRRLVSTLDVFATCLDLAKVPFVSGDFDSLSFADSLGGVSTTPLRTASYAARFGPNGFGPYNTRERMVRDKDNFKLIIREVLGVETSRELYNLSSDPSESSPLNDPAKEAELEAILLGV